MNLVKRKRIFNYIALLLTRLSQTDIFSTALTTTTTTKKLNLLLYIINVILQVYKIGKERERESYVSEAKCQ